jgi:DNA-binding MarR family transcriptional regulator
VTLDTVSCGHRSMVVYMQHHSAVAIAKNAVAIAKIMGEQCVAVRIGRLHRLVARRFEQGLAPLDLTLPRLELLAWLTLAGGPVRPATLADRLAVERSTMSRNLARLEKRSWVQIAERSPMGRSMTVVITDAGREMLIRAERHGVRRRGACSIPSATPT